MPADDFGPSTGTSETAKRASEDSKGAKRSWLKVYETLPPQMLNAYGPFVFMSFTCVREILMCRELLLCVYSS